MSKIIILDPDEKPPVVEKQEKYDSKECEHRSTEISLKRCTLVCRDCKAYLDAFAWLAHWVQENNRFSYWHIKNRQLDLEHIREKKRVALETLEAAGVTVEEYAKYIENAPTRKEQLDLDTVKYEAMLNIHKKFGGPCPEETCYIFKKRNGYARRCCFVCGSSHSISDQEEKKLRLKGLSVFHIRSNRYNRAKAKLRGA
jgi:hypothetical protein